MTGAPYTIFCLFALFAVALFLAIIILLDRNNEE